MPDLLEAFDWRAALRRRRAERNLSQRTLSERSGLSLSAVKAYERGARRPSLAALEAMLGALGLPREEANEIRAGAGFAIDWNSLLQSRYVFDLADARTQLNELPWPAFLTNQGFGLIHANRALQLIWNIDEQAESPLDGDRNFLGRASMMRFVQFVENYDELLLFMLGLVKGDPRQPQRPDQPAPWLQAPMEQFLGGDPAFIRRLLGLWERAVPIPHRSFHRYDVHWRFPGVGAIHFIGLLTVGDIWGELGRTDWVPAGTEDWRRLEMITSRPRTAE